MGAARCADHDPVPAAGRAHRLRAADAARRSGLSRRRWLVVAGLAASLAHRPALAQPTPSAPPPAAQFGAPLVFADDTLLRLYGTLGPFTPSARAQAVADRMRAIERVVAEGGDTILVTDREGSSELTVGDLVLMTVLDADAAPTRVPRPLLARRHAATIRSALIADADRHSRRAILLDALYAGLATIVLVAVLLALRWGFPRLDRRIAALRRVRLRAFRIQQFELLSAGRLSTLLLGVSRAARVILSLLVLYLYVPLVLSFFPWTAPLSHRIVGYVVRPFAAAWAAFAAYAPNLFYLAAGVIIVRYVLAFLRVVFEAIGAGTITFHGFFPDWAEPTYKILRVLVIAFAAIVLYPFLPGASSDAFKGVSIFLGVLVSLGSSAAVGNVVAGVVLTYTRAFQLGDRVKIGETVGDVIEKTLLVTRIRTIKNVAVTVPNGTVLASQVVNYSTLAGTRGVILNTSVTIGYDVPWRQVHELLVAAARRTEDVRADPAPFVLQTSLDDFYVSYELNAYTDRPDLMAVIYSRLHESIQETFNASNVEIMSPHYRALRDGAASTVVAPTSAALLLLAALAVAAPSRARAQELGWSGTAEASANLLFGAASGRIVSSSLGAARADSALEIRGDAQLTYADQRNADDRREVRARSSRLSFAVDARPFAPVSPFAFGSAETSLQQRIAVRVSGGAGAKWTLLRRDDDDVSVSLALLAEETRALNPAPEVARSTQRVRWSTRVRVRRQLGPALKLAHVTFYQPTADRPSRYTLDSSTMIALAMTETLALTATLRDRIDSEARGRGARSAHDGQLLFGAKATF